MPKPTVEPNPALLDLIDRHVASGLSAVDALERTVAQLPEDRRRSCEFAVGAARRCLDEVDLRAHRRLQ
jgi:hypothetical protein